MNWCLGDQGASEFQMIERVLWRGGMLILGLS
jgi:hypothetical protein